MTDTRINWRTSSYSNQGTCVEVADLPDGDRLVRDTKDRTRPPLHLTGPAWHAFVTGVKAGEFR